MTMQNSPDDRHHAGHRDRARRIATGHLDDHCQHRRRQHRIGAEHENPAGTEYRIGKQRHDGRVDP
jgi:hypothetical protein